jgi:hypothetical protein
MNKVLLSLGVLLFLIGSTLIIGAFFIFNKYSVSGSHDFGGYYKETWNFPDVPLDLSEGDKVIIKTLRLGIFDGKLYIKGTSEEQVLLSDRLGNGTLYYYIQKNDFYSLSIVLSDWGSSSFHSITLETTIISKSPNFLVLLVGILLLFGSMITVLSTFSMKRLRRENLTP